MENDALVYKTAETQVTLTLFAIMHKIYNKGFYLYLYEAIDGSYLH